LYFEEHAGEGPHLLLLHGFLSSRAQWRLNLAGFAAFSRPVVVELWGHGRSPAGPSPEHYRPDGYLRELERIRAAVGAERWLVCGQSLGASITLRYSLEHPERVIAQVFTNSNSALATETQVRERLRDAAGAIEEIETVGHPAIERLRVHPKHAKRLPEAVKEELVDDARILSPQAVADSYRYLNPIATVRDRAHEIAVPTMLACGRYEKRFAEARRFAEATIPDLETVDLDAGHAVNIEAAEAFDRHAGEFLRAQL
jgi:pimeloyl-ACP methyl ester carboxylesterase